MEVSALSSWNPVEQVEVCNSSSLCSLEARREFVMLERWIFSEALDMPLHEVEAEQSKRAREMSRKLLQAHIAARGRGDVGLQILVTPADSEARIHKRGNIDDCKKQTIFGEVAVERKAYSCPGQKSIHPVDEVLELPERSFSYELQRIVTKGAIQGPFDEAIETVEEFTGVSISKRSAEDIVKDAAKDFDAFYEQREIPPAEETGPILVGAVDGKGIPMKKPETAERVVRRRKGEKASKKKMATVAAVYPLQPRIRTPEEVVESLFRTPLESAGRHPSQKLAKPENKRVWASLKKGKDLVIQEVQEEMDRRDPNSIKKRVAVTDGERALQRRVVKWLTGNLLILDLLHVLEKLWKAAYVFHAEGSEEATQWVKDRVLSILRGNVSLVVRGIRQSCTKRGFKGKELKVLTDVTGYLYRNRHYMKYHEYLAAGLPIASGAVEGACKNLIKDRMERSGMRWVPEMAEAMVQLRAAYLSGDFYEYWAFHITQDQKRLFPMKGMWKLV